MTNVARTGQTILIAASSMFFAAFTSAMVVRRGIGADWAAPELPPWLWLSALCGPVASYFLWQGRRAAAVAAGSLLVLLQLAALPQFRLAVIGEAFLAVLIAAHAAHAAAGVLAVARFGPAAALFWHFAGILWLYILFLFGVWA